MADIRSAASGVAARSGWYLRASRRYAAWMTSSSASRSTWRTLYGSMPSAIVRAHADRRERRGQGLRLVRREAPEEVTHDVAEGCRDRQREDRTEEPGQRAADDDREHDDGRVQLDGVALDLG